MRGAASWILFGWLLVACGGGGGGGGSADAPTGETAGGDAAAGDPAKADAAGTLDGAGIDTGHDPALCERIWQRLLGCGHVYTFPELREDCADWQRSGDVARLDQLELCAVVACARLVECLEELQPGSE